MASLQNSVCYAPSGSVFSVHVNSHRSSSAAICAAVVVAAAVATAFLQYLMPASFDNAPQVNHAGVAQFSDALFGRRWPALSTMAFVWTFRALLTVMWLAYALMLRSLLADPRPRRWALPLVVTSAVAIAVIFPPSLSGDLYAYAGWGRMVVFHGGNPYVDTLASLAAAGDAAARVNPVPAPSNHGPLWVLVVSAVVWLAPTPDPFLQVLTLKLLAAAAVVTAALSARTLGAETASGGRDLPLAAIGLNPLLVVEGPGSGHNDMFMVALMLAGFASHICRAEVAGLSPRGLVGRREIHHDLSDSVAPSARVPTGTRGTRMARYRSGCRALSASRHPQLRGSLARRADVPRRTRGVRPAGACD